MTDQTFVETKQYRRFEEFCDNCAKYINIWVYAMGIQG